MSVLDDMGLSGMQVLSDTDALAVRGMGYGVHKKPWVRVGGNSTANLSQLVIVKPLKFGYFDAYVGPATSYNDYAAEGRYKAGGDNHSVAGFTIEHIKIDSLDGSYNLGAGHKKIKTVQVFAGGYSSGYAF